MSDTKTQQLVLAIIEFLTASIENGTVKKDDQEGLEVAVQCIGEAFGVDPTDSAQSQRLSIKPATLPSLFQVYLKTRDKAKVSPSGPPAASTSAPGPSSEEKANAEKHKLAGNQHMAAKSYTGAIQSYSKAIECDGTNPVFYSNRAAAYSSQGDHQNAILDAKRAIELDSKFAKAYHRLGYAHFALGQFGEARDAFEEGLTLDPANVALRSGLENAKAQATSGASVPASSTPSAGGSGEPNFEDMMRGMGGGGAGGGPDLASLMSNPMMRQMAEGLMKDGGLERLMQNPAVANMMNRVNSGGGMPSMSELMSDPSLRDAAQSFMGGKNTH